MKKLILLLILLPSLAYAKVSVYFSPSTRCEQEIVELINQSRNNIDVAMYSINNDEIVNALKRAHDRGVKIRILTDKLQASSRYSKVIELYRYGINIRVHSKFKIEHNKFAIFDSLTATSGSYNWTNPASSKNSENCIFFSEEQETIAQYQNRFNYLWQQNTKKKSDIWFAKKLKSLS